MLIPELQPLQGQVHNNLYQTWTPPPPLSHWVHYFWQLDVPVGEFFYRSVPDNCVDLIISLNNLDEAILVSPFTEPIVYPIAGPTRYFGIRFRLLGQYSLFPETVEEWSPTDHQLPIRELLSPLFIERLQESLSGSKGFHQSCVRLARVMLDHIDRPVIDPRVLKFVRYCYQSPRHFSLKELAADQLGITDRQLRRLTQQYLGVSPKAFCQVARFQHVLRAWQVEQDKTAWADWYFDQSHFSREFSRLAGISPNKFSAMSVLYNRTSSQSRIILPSDNV
ncbi:helix-turn-helix domain-containing protein [Vibrio atypicus]|jgi:AraC-like DNA-binding protein|uniref:helix-turn-helix domain-containing protein n=1 Tax=Vibrio atypicus TaxID=558271 RepID=UPI001357D164|nr:helix-turn-helix domain-containing protein [Vibrio atypicus]